jgi:hypothetical protein
MFEKATRLKLRFPSPKGALSIEDLWDLPLTSANGPNLDKIAQALNRELKESANESFVVRTTAVNTALQLKFDIVKHIIDIKLVEEEASKTRRENKQKKDKIMEIFARKQDAALENLTVEELQKKLDEL